MATRKEPPKVEQKPAKQVYRQDSRDVILPGHRKQASVPASREPDESTRGGKPVPGKGGSGK